MRLPSPCLVVLVGPAAAGKSTWAAEQFRPDHVVSSDRLRGLVGESEYDQRAGKDTFDVLDLVLQRRLRRKLTTVLDTTGLDSPRRRGYLAEARKHGLPAFVVVFATPLAECRRRNAARPRKVPAAVVSGQWRATEAAGPIVAAEGWDGVFTPEPVDLVPAVMWQAPAATARQKEAPMALRFGLQIPSFTWPGGPPEIRPRLRDIAQAAEAAGFTSLWVMDHFLQIPPVGPEWWDMLDSYTTLGFLADATESVRLGALVAGVTYRNVAHLAKIVATLDVLSGGRAVCGIGAAWFEKEHRAYGWTFPPLKERFALLEDALQALPLLWGPGSPPFQGRVIDIPECTCYPRPLQEPRPPIMVGGSGERRTLRLVARYADACNLFGDAATVARKLEVLAKHCDDVGRDMSEIEVTQLSTTLVAADPAEAVERLRPKGASPERFAASTNAGTPDDHIGRFRQLAEAGVQTAIVNLPDLGGPEPVERFAEVIAAFD